MKKFVLLIVCFILWSLFCAGSGYIYHKKTVKPIIIPGETQWKHSVIYRNYPTMTADDLVVKLKCYDQSEFKLNVIPLSDPNKLRIVGNLCDRSAYKDLEFNCGESGNFKLYAGITLGAAVTGAATYGIYKVIK